jgi:hypothetical protein
MPTLRAADDGRPALVTLPPRLRPARVLTSAATRQLIRHEVELPRPGQTRHPSLNASSQCDTGSAAGAFVTSRGSSTPRRRYAAAAKRNPSSCDSRMLRLMLGTSRSSGRPLGDA